MFRQSMWKHGKAMIHQAKSRIFVAPWYPGPYRSPYTVFLGSLDHPVICLQYWWLPPQKITTSGQGKEFKGLSNSNSGFSNTFLTCDREVGSMKNRSPTWIVVPHGWEKVWTYVLFHTPVTVLIQLPKIWKEPVTFAVGPVCALYL